MNNHAEIFTSIYENSVWGSNNNENYNGGSGPGSALENNINTWIPFVKKFIAENNISTIVDLGCGDFVCGEHIYDDLEDITYYGYDAYDKVVKYHSQRYSKDKYNFIHLDFFDQKKEIVPGDLCILKDVLMHWNLFDINIFLDYLVMSRKFKYILIANCGNQSMDNIEVMTGSWRPLSANYYPLKKYRPKIIYNFTSNEEKEVSVIEINK